MKNEKSPLKSTINITCSKNSLHNHTLETAKLYNLVWSCNKMSQEVYIELIRKLFVFFTIETLIFCWLVEEILIFYFERSMLLFFLIRIVWKFRQLAVNFSETKYNEWSYTEIFFVETFAILHCEPCVYDGFMLVKSFWKWFFDTKVWNIFISLESCPSFYVNLYWIKNFQYKQNIFLPCLIN